MPSRIDDSPVVTMIPQRMYHSIGPPGGRAATCVPFCNRSCRARADGCIRRICTCHLLDTTCRPFGEGVPPCPEGPGGTSACMATMPISNCPIMPSGGHGKCRIQINHTPDSLTHLFSFVVEDHPWKCMAGHHLETVGIVLIL